jgi:hypothetical protein
MRVRMSVVSLPDFTPLQYRRARIGILLLLFWGLISFVAVAKVYVDCRDELLTGDDGVTVLTGGGKLLTTGRQQCQLAITDKVRVALPPWVQAVLSGKLM